MKFHFVFFFYILPPQVLMFYAVVNHIIGIGESSFLCKRPPFGFGIEGVILPWGTI